MTIVVVGPSSVMLLLFLLRKNKKQEAMMQHKKSHPLVVALQQVPFTKAKTVVCLSLCWLDIK
jgi:hypothetical protein